jgi:hypothetical protein
MPRVLRDLRIEEISAVTKGAGAGTRIVLMKRDDSDDRDNFYTKLFRGVGKSSGRVARHPPRMRSHDVHSTRAEALRGLLFTPDGHALMRARPDTDISTLAEHLVESASAVTTKRNNEVTNMDLIEVCKSVNDGTVEPPTEGELYAEIQKLANASRKPGETSAVAFDRLYSAQDDAGLTLRKAVRINRRDAAEGMRRLRGK